MVTPLRTILKTVTKNLALEPAANLARAQAIWPALVGPAIAAASTPVALRNQRLMVGVTHPAVGQEIGLRQGQIVAALREALGAEVVAGVRTVHRRSLAAPSRHAKRRS
jgi:predicted nucleic acid-binding Zn ribbon protein